MATKLYAVADEILDHLRYVARKLDCSDNLVDRSAEHDSADSIATSVPAPIAIPTSAVANAGIVDPVSNHCNQLSARLKPPYRRSFPGRQNLGCDLIYPDASRDRIRNGFRVSRDHRHSDTKPMKFPDGFNGLRPDLIFSAESAEQLPSRDDIQNRLSFGCPGAGRPLNFCRHRCLGLGQQPRSTTTMLASTIACALALPVPQNLPLVVGVSPVLLRRWPWQAGVRS